MARLIPLGFLSGGFTWSIATSGLNLSYNGAIYANLANAKFMGFGANSINNGTTNYRYSLNGTSGWTTGTMPASKRWGKAATNGSRVVVVSKSSDTVGAYTDNGTTWTSTTIFSSATEMRDIIWDGTRFIAVGQSATQNLAHSTDGATWTRIDTGDGAWTIGYDGTSRYIIGVDANQNIARTCTGDPTVAGNWSNLTMPAVENWVSFAYGNGIWVANPGNQNQYATSTNGTTWTVRSGPVGVTDDNLDFDGRVFFHDGLFYLGGANTVGTSCLFYSSQDGINWKLLLSATPGTLASINGFAASSNVIVGFGYTTQTVGTSDIVLGIR